MKKFIFLVLCIICTISGFSNNNQSYTLDSNNMSINIYSNVKLQEDKDVKELDIEFNSDLLELLEESNKTNIKLADWIYNNSEQESKKNQISMIDDKHKRLMFVGNTKEEIKEMYESYITSRKVKFVMYFIFINTYFVIIVGRYMDKKIHNIKHDVIIYTTGLLCSIAISHISFLLACHEYIFG